MIPEELKPYDYRENLLTDRDNPILIQKAWRDGFSGNSHWDAGYGGHGYLSRPNSEDALTWQVFRSLEAAGLLDRFVEDLLGIPDQCQAYYWQRPWHQYVIDPRIDQALAEVEPDKRLRRAGHLVLRD